MMMDISRQEKSKVIFLELYHLSLGSVRLPPDWMLFPMLSQCGDPRQHLEDGRQALYQ